MNTDTSGQKIVLITGGSSGIGKATAARLLALPERHGVTICGRSVAKLEAAIGELEPDGTLFQAIQADVSQPQEVERLVTAALEKFGRIDALVNSAGVGYLGPLSETAPETMDRLWNTNVRGAMLMSQAVSRHFVGRKAGQIVNLCGVLGVKTIANASLYCATKHALVGFGSSLAQELKRSNVSVTSLCCSGVDSPFWEGVPGKPRAEMLLTPDDIAREIVHLLTQPAHMITNQLLVQHTAHQL